MKKTIKLAALITAFVASAAMAQSNTTIGGEVRMFEDNTKTGTAKSVNRMSSDESHVGIKVTEAVANGITVRANVDTFITANAPAASSFGSYQSTIGVGTKFGSVDFGRKKTTMNLIADSSDAFDNRHGSTFGTVHNLQTTRLDNGVFVETAEYMGLKGTYNFGQSNVSNVAGTTGVGLVYSAFGGNLHYAGQFEKATGAKTNLIGIGYTIPKVGTKLGFDTSNSRTSSVSDRSRGNSFSVEQPVWANLAVKGTYGQTKTDNVAGRTYATSLGLAYNLSKRTAVETAYSKVNAPGVVADTRLFGVGLTHAF